jgi:OOP family OmpA-OmpF porin
MKKSLLLLLTICCQHFLFAQDEAIKDAENCKDHPMFTRMPNTFITECQSNFDEVEIHMSADKIDKKEGNKTSINYTYNYDSKVAPPSFLQIVKNYENALAKFGGKRIFFGKEQGVATLFVKNDGKDTWISLLDFGGIGAGQFGLIVLEMEAMKQDITATAIMDELNKSGRVALYINFETGKSAIKPESQNIIDNIAAMLQSDPALKVSIEGHTDNVGTPASNKILSENRAKSVVAALVVKGIDKTRLSAKGWGQEKPVADNSSEDGKAKNRRVEIVKL